MRFRRQQFAVAAFTTVVSWLNPLCVQAADLTGHLQSAIVLPLGGDNQRTVQWFQEVRAAMRQDLGTAQVDAAYEFTVRRGQPESGHGTDWLDLQDRLSRDGTVETRHRLDRLRLAWNPVPDVDIDIGRQAVSWATTVYLTPADPFAPFGTTDTVREYRRGIDALRMRAYPGELSEIDLVLRPSRLPKQKEGSLLGRLLTTRGDWELSAWAGSLYGDAAGAVGSAGDIGDWAVRFEAVARDLDGRRVGRGAVGIDRTFRLSERDLHLALEYQHDALAASGPTAFAILLRSDPYRRGELQVLARDVILLRVAYQLHPLWDMTGLVLRDLNAGGTTFAPGFSHSLSEEAVLSGGIVIHRSDRVLEEPSTAGRRGNDTTASVNLSLSWYF